jgi:hypothetical protein
MLLQVIVSGWCSRGFPMRPEFFVLDFLNSENAWAVRDSGVRRLLQRGKITLGH